MRNAYTDTLAITCNSHFKESKLPVGNYIQMLVDQADAFDTTDTSFHIIKDVGVVMFYYTKGAWYCKY